MQPMGMGGMGMHHPPGGPGGPGMGGMGGPGMGGPGMGGGSLSMGMGGERCVLLYSVLLCVLMRLSEAVFFCCLKFTPDAYPSQYCIARFMMG